MSLSVVPGCGRGDGESTQGLHAFLEAVSYGVHLRKFTLCFHRSWVFLSDTAIDTTVGHLGRINTNARIEIDGSLLVVGDRERTIERSQALGGATRSHRKCITLIVCVQPPHTWILTSNL